MAKKSCTTNLLEFLEKITAEVDKGYAMDIVYLDFSKAFDVVPHERLLKKMEAHGVCGRILDWIRDSQKLPFLLDSRLQHIQAGMLHKVVHSSSLPLAGSRRVVGASIPLKILHVMNTVTNSSLLATQ